MQTCVFLFLLAGIMFFKLLNSSCLLPKIQTLFGRGFIVEAQHPMILSREWMDCWGLLGVAGMIITSEPVDHSQNFPAFSTSKSTSIQEQQLLQKRLEAQDVSNHGVTRPIFVARFCSKPLVHSA